jgi:polysaccharide export outer membrane protein
LIQTNKILIFLAGVIVWAFFLLQSCVSHEELVNFNKEPILPLGDVEEIINQVEPRIQVDDILHITVNSYDEEAASPFNRALTFSQGGGFNTNNQNTILLHGYLVDSSGNIDFPVIGQMKVSGFTLAEARSELESRLTRYLKDAVVNVRYLNYRFTVLGEVTTPGTYSSYNTKITVMEALGLAGDLTDYANRERILVIREKNGHREYAMLSLKDKRIFLSPYYYLKQNDVIYIEPIEARVATVADPAFRWISFGSALLSLVTFVITIAKR